LLLKNEKLPHILNDSCCCKQKHRTFFAIYSNLNWAISLNQPVPQGVNLKNSLPRKTVQAIFYNGVLRLGVKRYFTGFTD
jgi:hypothetical protein